MKETPFLGYRYEHLGISGWRDHEESLWILLILNNSRLKKLNSQKKIKFSILFYITLHLCNQYEPLLIPLQYFLSIYDLEKYMQILEYRSEVQPHLHKLL